MKIAVIGLGKVGVTVSYTLLMRGLATELVLVSRRREFAEAEALDLGHAATFLDEAVVVRAGGAEESAGSDLLIVTDSVPADAARNTREDWAAGNYRRFQTLLPPLARASPEATILVITNPVDVMTYHTIRITGFAPGRVIGTGTLIDSARFRKLLSTKFQIHCDDVRAYILGEHGDGQFPALSVAVTGGERIDSSDAVLRLFEQAVASGHEVFRRRGYTNYAIAMAAALIVESIAHDLHRTIPVSTLVDGYLGVRDVCLSVPAVIGRGGVIRLLHPALSEDEAERFRRSGETVRALIGRSVGDAADAR
jgi:L-lactate dehydrogenase